MAGLNSITPTRPHYTKSSAFLTPFPLTLTMPHLVSLTRGPPVIHHGVNAEKSPNYKQVVDRQSHTTTNVPIIIMIQMQSRVPVKTSISACIPPKLPANCCFVRQLQQQNYPQKMKCYFK